MNWILFWLVIYLLLIVYFTIKHVKTNDLENYLVNNIPEFIAVDSENDDYKLFLQMIGHHFDIIWSYIKGLERLKTVEEKHRMGVTDDMLKHILKNYSWIPASSKNS